MSNNAHELSNRLLNALDNNYNVVDMHAVNEIISILEKINITKELLETTRLGKHVNELRRKTSEPSLARRAKVLVKRWRDLVIPTVASPGHTGSNRSSAERSVRRHGGTPLTSPALSRQVVSPAVPSPRPPSRPAWGGYESDSQDVILVDDEPAPPPPPPPPAHTPHPPHAPSAAHHANKPLTPPVKRPQSPTPHDEKKTKRDKKPKKRRGYSRAGAGAEAAPVPSEPPPLGLGAPSPAAPPSEPTAWSARNGSSHTERRRNGYKRDSSSIDPYAALVHRMPPAGAKKVKTTKELLEEIQSRKGGKPAAVSSPASPASPASPDVMLIETESYPLKVESPLRNGGSSPRPASRCSPSPSSSPCPPLEDEREHWDCTCELAEDETCPARGAQDRLCVQPHHVRALHNTYIPGVNGTRAPVFPHQFAVRKPEDPDRPGLFASVVPLYKYSDYADDYCVKNMDRVPLCSHLPWTEFAPPPPDLPPPPSPPPIRPYPLDEPPPEVEVKEEPPDETPPVPDHEYSRTVEAEMVGVPALEPSERLKAPLLSAEEETQFEAREAVAKMEVTEQFASEPQEHRTVERTKEEGEASGGRALYAQWQRARDAVPFDYRQLAAAPTLALPDEPALEAALAAAAAETGAGRDELGRPKRPTHFAEWHECARLGSLVALPYVVID